MKSKILSVLSVLSVLSLAPLFAGQLALVRVTPEQKREAARFGIEVYQDFGDALLLPLENQESPIENLQSSIFNLHSSILVDSCLVPGEYFLVFKAGKGRYSTPGRILWTSPRYALVRLSEEEALRAKAEGYPMTRIPDRPHPLAVEAPEFHLSDRSDRSYPSDLDTTVQRLISLVNVDSLRQTMLDLQGFQTRYTYSRKCDSAAWYLGQRFTSLGLAPEYDVYLCGTQHDTSYNVVATLPGQVHPESILIVCGHFDSYSDNPMISAPGADDNASGTAGVLEAARILSQEQFRWTVKFIAFSGEEQWMVGSYHWVDSVAVPQNLKIAGVYNLDMVAYTAYDTNLLYVNTNSPSRSLAVLAESVNAQYQIGLRLVNYLDPDCAGDNQPFWENGFPAVFALEDSEWGIWNGSNPYYHTTHDSLRFSRMGQVKRNAQMAVGCLATLAGPWSVTAIAEPSQSRSRSRESAIPILFSTWVAIPGREIDHFLVYDYAGKLRGRYAGNRIAADLPAGIYFIAAKGQGSPPVRVIKLR